MLYETLSGGKIFLCMVLGGFLCGLLFDAKRLIMLKISKKTKKMHFFEHFFMFFCTFFTIFTFYAINLKTNYGQFRFFSFAAFALALAVEQIMSSSLLAKVTKNCYNVSNEKSSKRKRNNKRKKET